MMFLFYPMLKSVYLSMTITDPRGQVVEFVWLENFVRLLSTDSFYKNLGVTLMFILFTVPTSLIWSLFLAAITHNKAARDEGVSVCFLTADCHFRRDRLDYMVSVVSSYGGHAELFSKLRSSGADPLVNRSFLGSDLNLDHDDLDEHGVSVYCAVQRFTGSSGGNIRKRQNGRLRADPIFIQIVLPPLSPTILP